MQKPTIVKECPNRINGDQFTKMTVLSLFLRCHLPLGIPIFHFPFARTCAPNGKLKQTNYVIALLTHSDTHTHIESSLRLNYHVIWINTPLVKPSCVKRFHDGEKKPRWSLNRAILLMAHKNISKFFAANYMQMQFSCYLNNIQPINRPNSVPYLSHKSLAHFKCGCFLFCHLWIN